MIKTYDEYKNNDLWEIVKTAIRDLEHNQDIKITTDDDYVIWYIVKSIIKNNNAMEKIW